MRLSASILLVFCLEGCHGAPAEPPAAPPPVSSAPSASAAPPPGPPADAASTTPSASGRVSIGKLFENPPTWDVRGIFRQNEDKFEACWAPVVNAQPGERGKLSIRFIVSSEGKVTKTEEVSSTFRDANLSACVQKVIAALPWAPPGGTATVVLPLVFRP